MKAYLLPIALIFLLTNGYAQSPNYALKTPETLEIIQIELTGDATLVKLSIENRVKDGYFCTDQDTYLITDKGLKIKLDNAIGIPVCPETHQFKSAGEKLYFTLKFPALPVGTSWVDLVEECGEMCFSIFGITLNPVINKLIDQAFSKLDAGMADEAIIQFISLLNTLEGTNHGILGSIYLNLITLYEKQGNTQKAREIHERLLNSDLPHKDLFIQSSRK